MGGMPFELVITFARQLLLTLGGSLVGAGYMTGDQLTAAVGVVIQVATIIYGLISKWSAVEQQKNTLADLKEVKQELKEVKKDSGFSPVSPDVPRY